MKHAEPAAYAVFGVLATLVGVAAGHLVASLLEPGLLPGARRRLPGHRPDAHADEGVGDPAVRQQRQADPDRLGAWAACWCSPRSPGCWPGAGSRSAPGCCVVLVAVAAFTALNRPGRRARSTSCPRWPPRSPASARCGCWTARATAASPPATVAERLGPAPRAAACWSPRGVLAATAAVMGGAGRLDRDRTAPGSTDIALPEPADPAPAFPTGIEAQVPGHHAAADPDRRLLPRRHPPRRADRRPRRLDADHRRRRRQGARPSPSTTCSRCRSSSATSR